MKTTNIMIVGVGGQGSLLASRILGHVFISKGYDVKVSEVHGMSQRGGTVITYVKYGEKVYSPTIAEGDADFIIAFEKLEALRHIPFLKKGGVVVTNTQEIMPMPVITGAMEYPKDIPAEFEKLGVHFVGLDALDLAIKAGAVKATNVVLLGVYAKKSGIDKEEWIKAINECVPAKFLEQNLKAFELGYTYK